MDEIDFQTIDGWNTLTVRKQKWIVAYLKSGNGTEAAKVAGYSPRAADVTAAKLKRDIKVKSVMDQVRKAIFSADALSIEESQSILARIARGKLSKFLKSDGSIDFNTVKQQSGTEIDSISVSDGEDSHSEKIKLRDPVSAIKLAAQLAGWGEKKDSDAASIGSVNYFFGLKREGDQV